VLLSVENLEGSEIRCRKKSEMSHASRSVVKSSPSVDHAAAPSRTEGEASEKSKAETMLLRNRVTVCLRIRPFLDFDSDRDQFLRWSNRRPNCVTTIENTMHRQQAFEFDYVRSLLHLTKNCEDLIMAIFPYEILTFWLFLLLLLLGNKIITKFVPPPPPPPLLFLTRFLQNNLHRQIFIN